MFGNIWIVSARLTVIIALLTAWAATVARFSFFATVREAQHSLHPPTLPLTANDPAQAASPCVNALAQRAVCGAANKRALEIINANRLEAVTVVQDVQTGAVVAFAARRPSDLDVTTPVNPLSLSKLLISASWWDNRQPDSRFDSTNGKANAPNPAYRARVSVHEMLVGGSDSAGMQMAVALRRAVGTKTVLDDFKRYGFGQRTGQTRDDTFWNELAPSWATRLIPAPAYVSLSYDVKDAEWADSLSIGHTNIRVTTLHVSRFLQAVGNNGVGLTPVAREEQSTPSATKSPVSRGQLKNSIHVMQESTALRLQSAMRDTVERGTAKSIAGALENTGWQLGGKTGSGIGLMPKGAKLDGWFAGLIFDPQGKARFTVATFVRRGGLGGGNAAKISAELARYIIGEQTAIGRQNSGIPTVIKARN